MEQYIMLSDLDIMQTNMAWLCLTHLPIDNMASFPQTIFSDAFSWMKRFVYW